MLIHSLSNLRACNHVIVMVSSIESIDSAVRYLERLHLPCITIQPQGTKELFGHSDVRKPRKKMKEFGICADLSIQHLNSFYNQTHVTFYTCS